MSKPMTQRVEARSISTDELEVKVCRYGPRDQPDIVHIYKRSLLWIINSLRGKTPNEYLLGAKEDMLKDELIDSHDYSIFLMVYGVDDRNGQGAVQLSVVNRIHPTLESDPADPGEKKYGGVISIDTDARDAMDPQGTLYQFLERLEPFVPAEERDKIIPAWEPQKR